MGHEPTSTIAKVGSEVTKFKVGDRVFAHHHVGCISCHQCSHHALCENFRKYRLDPGGMAEYFRVPEDIPALTLCFCQTTSRSRLALWSNLFRVL